MLATPIYKGQGLGNQLACYITTRCIALDKGYEFGVIFPERFKGFFFKNLSMPELKGFDVFEEGGQPYKIPEGMKYYRETSSDYDNFILNIPDNYIIHGNLQGEKYFEKYKDNIRHWLKVEPLDMSDDLCVINFRGGEYVGVHDFFLPLSYWNMAIGNMLLVNPKIKFEVHTDDPITAQKFFPNFKVIQNMELNWRSIRFAKYLIISNSSFAWMPAWLNTDVKLIIAPKFWGRYNKDYWFLEQNRTKCFSYQDKNGNLDNQQF